MRHESGLSSAFHARVALHPDLAVAAQVCVAQAEQRAAAGHLQRADLLGPAAMPWEFCLASSCVLAQPKLKGEAQDRPPTVRGFSPVDGSTLTGHVEDVRCETRDLSLGQEAAPTAF